MSTYADAVYSALLTADEPMSSRSLYEANDTFETPDQVNKAIGYLVKTGRAEVAGTEKPKNGKTIRLYRALTPDEQTERKPSDLDQQLAAAIRERDTELSEAVIEPLAAAGPLIGEWPDALEERPVFPREWSDDPMPKAPRYELKRIDRPSVGDPIISAIRRLPVGRMKLQGLDHDIRRVRSLADTIGDAGPDVSAWLNDLANKLEAAA